MVNALLWGCALYPADFATDLGQSVRHNVAHKTQEKPVDNLGASHMCCNGSGRSGWFRRGRSWRGSPCNKSMTTEACL